MLKVSWEGIVAVVFIASAVATVSMTVTRALIFRSFRKWVESKSEFLGDLFACPYCTSHWVAAVAAALVWPRVIMTSSIVLDVVLSALSIVAVTSVWCKIIHWAYMEMVDYGEEYED